MDHSTSKFLNRAPLHSRLFSPTAVSKKNSGVRIRVWQIESATGKRKKMSAPRKQWNFPDRADSGVVSGQSSRIELIAPNPPTNPAAAAIGFHFQTVPRFPRWSNILRIGGIIFHGYSHNLEALRFPALRRMSHLQLTSSWAGPHGSRPCSKRIGHAIPCCLEAADDIVCRR